MSVTIGIPFYNPGEYFLGAINSVLSQDFSDFELLLIDDGSTDGSLELANSISDPRIRVISDGKNKKLPARLNDIIKEAKYGFIARMDADDLIFPERIRLQYEFLQQNPHIDLVSTGLVSFSSDLSIQGERSPSSSMIFSKESVLKGQSGIVHASVMARKSWFERNPYNEKNMLAEDYELWINAFLKNDLKVGFIDKPLYLYREDQNVKLRKMLKGYSSQANFIKSLSNQRNISLGLSLKIMAWFYMKMIYITPFFFLKKEEYLLKRRSGSISKKTVIKTQELFSKINHIRQHIEN